MRINFKLLFISLAIPLAVGGLSAWLTRNSMELYKSLNQPPLAPPGWVFPIVWTILFILMGISSYMIYTSHSHLKQTALLTYGIQLALNFSWSILFFLVQGYTLAFFLIIILLYFIGKMIYLFKGINKTAALLQLPYFLWVIFATYLNLGVAILN